MKATAMKTFNHLQLTEQITDATTTYLIKLKIFDLSLYLNQNYRRGSNNISGKINTVAVMNRQDSINASK